MKPISADQERAAFRQRLPTRIPAARYYGAGWAALEWQRLWSNVWQFACAVDCVAKPGDYYEYRIGHLSALIVRGDDGEIRGFQNACRHRGSALLDGAGTGLQEIRCPYHHWSYDLRGRRGDTSGDLGLHPLATATFGGLVFVNWDVDAEPLDAFLKPLVGELAWLKMERYTCRHALTVAVQCNWKLIMDAFNEAYHIHAVHPQLLPAADDVNLPIRLLGRHSSFEQTFGVASPRLGCVDDEAMWRAFVENVGHRLGHRYADTSAAPPMPEIPPGSTLRNVLLAMLRARLEELGDPYPDLGDREVMNDFHYHFFPNTVMNSFAGWFGLIRARPGDTPEQSWLDMWNFDLLAPDDTESHCFPRAAELAADQCDALGLVLKQDIDMLPQIQRGLSQPGASALNLVAAEQRIGHMHRVLDAFMGTSLDDELARADGQTTR